MDDKDAQDYEERLAEVAAENERLQAEAEAADAQARLAALTQDLAEARRESTKARATATSLGESYRRAVDEYRSSLTARHPEVPPDLVKGETVEEVQESVRAAHSLVEQVRERLEAAVPAAEAPRVPPGAPARRGPDVDAMPAREKIAEGLRRTQP